MRMNQLHQAADCLAYSFYITALELRSEAEVPVNEFGKIPPTHLTQGLSEIVHHKAVTRREHGHLHLGYFPSRDVKVNAVQERHVLANHVRHRCEEMRRADHHVH